MAMTVLSKFRSHGEERSGEFREVIGNDEMVSNGPGFDIPTPSLTRWPYDEYHTSDDNPSIVKPENLSETLDVFMGVWNELEQNYYPKRKFKGPVMLSRYGLWVDWREDFELNRKLEKIMMMLEGEYSIVDIAYELELPAETVRNYLDRFFDAGLIDKSHSEL
jgi:aminopeptidase-like protein